MKPEEKAKELIEKFKGFVYDLDVKEYDQIYCKKTEKENAKACAIICVDEILDSIREVNNYVLTGLIDFWQQVKEAIQNH